MCWIKYWIKFLNKRQNLLEGGQFVVFIISFLDWVFLWILIILFFLTGLLFLPRTAKLLLDWLTRYLYRWFFVLPPVQLGLFLAIVFMRVMLKLHLLDLKEEVIFILTGFEFKVRELFIVVWIFPQSIFGQGT